MDASSQLELASLPRRLAANFIALVSSRLELLEIELDEAREQARRRFIWLGIAVLSGILAIQFSCVLILLAAPDVHRVWAAAGIAGGFLALALVSTLLYSHLDSLNAPAFALVREEFALDLASLRGEHGAR